MGEVHESHSFDPLTGRCRGCQMKKSWPGARDYCPQRYKGPEPVEGRLPRKRGRPKKIRRDQCSSCLEHYDNCACDVARLA